MFKFMFTGILNALIGVSVVTFAYLGSATYFVA